MSGWVEETLHRDFRLKLRSSRVLHQGETAFQRIALFENPTFGRVLALDDCIQTTERDEFIYHEMLTHLPMLAHGAVRRVLIIGGGDGGTLEEVLKHATVERVAMIEIDRAVIELSREYLPSICGSAFEDPRAEIVIGDGVEHVAKTDARYDLIIVDSSDPIGPAEALFTADFYADCRRCLNAGGVLVTQNGVPFLQADELRNTLGALRALFRDAACYIATVPTYTGGPMAFGWGCDDPAVRATPPATLRERFAAAGLGTRYYRPEIHAAAFALPGYIAALAGEAVEPAPGSAGT